MPSSNCVLALLLPGALSFQHIPPGKLLFVATRHERPAPQFEQ
jgi:hypothetical protein